jgi:signal transduction histidine kinase
MSVEIREHAGRLVTEAGPALDLSVSETGCQSRSDVRVCAIGAGPFMVVVGASEADDRATRDSLSRVIANLLDNAAKHGAGAIVAVRAELDGAVVRISVVNGAREGELTERAFEPFFRGPRASGLPGFGLGLPFARAVARAHGGEPSIGSPSIEHTELVLSLPAVAWSDGLGAS